MQPKNYTLDKLREMLPNELKAVKELVDDALRDPEVWLEVYEPLSANLETVMKEKENEQISKAMSAQPIYKCAHCYSLNFRHATTDETKHLSDAPIKYEGLKIFSV